MNEVDSRLAISINIKNSYFACFRETCSRVLVLLGIISDMTKLVWSFALVFCFGGECCSFVLRVCVLKLSCT